jgi:hypothetical protein
MYAQNFPKILYGINYDYSYQVNKEDTLSKKREQMVLMLQKFFLLYVSLNNMKLMIWRKIGKSPMVFLIENRYLKQNYIILL